ncbi:MAG TPA: GDP-mannose 4,6-dehydratase [Mycobacteriales bacterium]|nr:GDP-mannose 4,6-dehydratase [Mycobacteriales bacterium]
MTRALITGVTGQDGGYLAERLVAEGCEVHGLVHAGDPQLGELTARTPEVVLHDGDLRDEAALARVVADAQPDEVYNLGGISSVALSWEKPVLTADVSGLGVARLLAAVAAEQERSGRRTAFVQASSAEVFGRAERAPQDERTPLRPTSPYGVAKVFGHQLCGVYRTQGVHAVSVILYNHESPRRPMSFVTRKITHAVARIAAGLQDELVLGNVDARRDWGWAPDYVDAMVRAARAPQPDDFVVATGEAHSVEELALAAFARAGVEPRIQVDRSLVRPDDPALLVGDASKARSVLGWSPTVGFEEIVARMVDADLALVAESSPQRG